MNDDASVALGVDLGGTKASGVILRADGTVARQLRRAHDSTGQEALDVAIDVVRELLSDPASVGIERVGLAVAGLVDRHSGRIVRGALLGLDDTPLGLRIESLIGLPVFVENDADATLAGVLHDPSISPDADDVSVLVALGTGVGGAVAVGDHVLRGVAGFAGELGHVPIEEPGRHPCPCGSSGCVELFASGTAVTRIARATTSFRTTEAVLAAAESGDRTARTLLTDAGTALGHALVPLVNALDPRTVFLSGGFGHAAATYLVPAMEARLRRQQSFPESRSLPRIVLDPIGPMAAAIGAAIIARDLPLHPARTSQFYSARTH
ncbi:ROK family protein [Herbiconiux sp. UC225_62]|uniref:ROK family protein n=1 Tax=Herbiconiux sp. UC225_62 TaxID=3350168 RepID=UPI0036D38B6F